MKSDTSRGALRWYRVSWTSSSMREATKRSPTSSGSTATSTEASEGPDTGPPAVQRRLRLSYVLTYLLADLLTYPLLTYFLRSKQVSINSLLCNSLCFLVTQSLTYSPTYLLTHYYEATLLAEGVSPAQLERISEDSAGYAMMEALHICIYAYMPMHMQSYAYAYAKLCICRARARQCCCCSERTTYLNASRCTFFSGAAHRARLRTSY